jgi:hypothetical protein
MKAEGAEGLIAIYERSPAANEQLTAMVKGPDGLARPQSGWDPYEVWRTRVKGSSTVIPERERGPLRWLIRLALRGRRLHVTTAEGRVEVGGRAEPEASGMLRT